MRERLRRLRRALFRRQTERDMDEEMEFHVAMHASESVTRGRSAEEARRSALLSFGGVDRHKEAARDALRGGAAGEWWRELRQSARSLGRRPGFVFVIVATLGIGIGANTAVFAVADALLLRPLPYPEAERLVQLWQATPGGRQWVSGPDFEDWRARLRTMERVAAFTPSSYNVATGEGAENVNGAAVTAGFFEALGVAPANGRVFRPDEDGPGSAAAVVLSAGLHRRLFGGDPSVVGRTVSVDGAPALVLGVMPAEFDFPRGAELWEPLRLNAEEWQRRRGIDWLMVLARTRRDADAALVDADLARVAVVLQSAYAETNADDRIEAVGLRDQLVGGIRTPVLLLVGAVGFVLALVCANVAGLMLSRATGRARELAVRRALGAGPRHLARVLFAEAVLLAVLGGAAGLGLGVLGGRLLVTLAPAQSGAPLDVGFDARVLTFTAAISALAAIVFGLAPALRSARVSPGDALAAGHARAGDARAAQRARRMLVVLQVTVAVVLVTGAGLLARSLANLRSEHPGFNADGVMTARIALTPAQYPDSVRLRAFYDLLLDRVRALPAVTAAGLISPLPLSGGDNAFSFAIEGEPPARPQDAPLAAFRTATHGYFAALGIPLIAGRDFEPRDDDGAAVAVIDETLARAHFGNRQPIGARIDVGGATRSVIGVAGAVRHSAVREPPRPTIYIPYAHRARPGMSLVARTTGDPAQLAGPIRDLVRDIDPAQPVFAVRAMSEYLTADVATTRFLAQVLVAFAATALFLALLGVYGVVAFAVACRAREIGIRLALGAEASSVLRWIMGDAMMLVAPGLAAGLILSVALSQLFDTLLYEVHAFDPGTLAGVVVFVGTAALLASYLPARRAASLDPARTLRVD